MLGFHEIISHNSKVYCTNNGVFQHQSGWHTRASTLVQKMTWAATCAQSLLTSWGANMKVNPRKHFWRLSRRAPGSSESGPCALRQRRAFPSFYTHSIGSSISKTTTRGQPEPPPRSATFILPGVLTTKKGKQDPALEINVVLEWHGNAEPPLY